MNLQGVGFFLCHGFLATALLKINVLKFCVISIILNSNISPIMSVKIDVNLII